MPDIELELMPDAEPCAAVADAALSLVLPIATTAATGGCDRYEQPPIGQAGQDVELLVGVFHVRSSLWTRMPKGLRDGSIGGGFEEVVKAV